MSKTTPQCDELRSMAESIGLAMPQAATLMMGAADCLDLALDSKRVAERRVTELLAENAKLKKLAHDLLQPILAEGFDCYGCVYEDDCEGMRYTDRCRLLDRACELRVEVDK